MSDSNVIDKVLVAVDALREEMTCSLKSLVRIPSVNPNYMGVSYEQHVGKEADGTALLADLYRRTGAEVDVFAIEAGRDNAVATLSGRGGGPSLAFNGHVDVVPPGEASEWRVATPFSGEIVDSRMYGRGATDQKSGLIAAAYAAIAIRNAGVELAGDLQLQCVVGEETGDSCGTGAVLGRGYRPDAAVVTEPSAPPAPLSIVLGSPGLQWLSVTVPGKKIHCAMRGATVHPTGPGESVGVNAIDKAVIVYNALRALENEWAITQRHELWPNGHFSLSPGVARGGAGDLGTPFALADWFTFDYAITSHPERSPESVRAEVEQVISRAADGDPWLRGHRPTCEWKLDWKPFLTAKDAALSIAAERAYVRAVQNTSLPATAAYTGFFGVCDATWFAEAGVPVLVLGPGDLSVAHGPDEFVKLEELWAAARIYALLAVEWCGVA